METQISVAYLGPPASYTHQAALEFYKNSNCVLQPQTTIEDVFQSVQSGVVSEGIVPFENSTNGAVILSLDLFADSGRYPDILVCGEAYLDIHHCLLGRRSPALKQSGPSGIHHGGHAPLASIRHVATLYSHPQVWGQCKTFISKYLKGIECIDVSSTSKAAEIVAKDASGTSAAISSSTAAEVHNLDFLARGIEDKHDNTTRFFILRKGVPHGMRAQLDTSAGYQNAMERFKSMVSFTVRHEDPGSLAESLAAFKAQGLNLTSINTRPSGKRPWHYVFFVEFKGRRRTGQEGAVNAALLELGKVAESWRWLGSWVSR